jgi:uncharacterized membrane protein YdjX (TVP38/TMEM64 family)
MSPEEPRERRKPPFVKLALAAVAVGALGYLLLRGMDFKAVGHHALAYIRDAGPWAFFAGMAILPAFSAPLSAFTIVAGEAFGKEMTIPGVIAASLVAISVNLAFTYWLARYALRPLLSKVIGRYGYTVPRVTRENALSITLFLRLTPGPPFFMQSYILGLAEAPFVQYMVVSSICNVPWTIAFIVLGQGIFNGNFKLVAYGIGVIAAASIAIHWIRKRHGTRAA